MIKVGVRILPRREVLDSQGRAVLSLCKSSFRAVEDVRVGRFVVLELDVKDRDAALMEARRLAEQILHNPLIETFELEAM